MCFCPADMWAADSPGGAEVTVEVPLGAWVEYKYARGGWDTVEKDAECDEVRNRFVFAAGGAAVDDEIAAMRSVGCP